MKLNKRQKRLLFKVIILIIISISGYYLKRDNVDIVIPEPIKQVSQNLEAGYYKVAKFDDGDTIMVEMNGKNETIRFIGVDTPEVKDPRKPVQCYGKAASNFTKQLISDNPVKLEADPQNTNRDRYNRLLRYVYLPDGTLVNAEIIKQGYGFAYTSFPFTKKDEFKALQQTAMDNNLGLWGKCELTPNKYGGFTPNAE